MCSVYIALLVASHAYELFVSGVRGFGRAISDEPHVLVQPRLSDGSKAAGGDTPLYYEAWTQIDYSAQKTPVLILHGSPGRGANFQDLGPELRSDHRRVYAPDLPGYGRSPMTPDMSHRANAHMLFEFLDQVSVDRVHVVGWSSSGGIVLEMANIDPDRVASVTMLASIGAQETEGSGSYHFEHLKYAVGVGIFGVLPELIPHFGLLGDFKGRAGWLWAFWDSDQRRQSEIMGQLRVPVLILHGRNDPLVAARGAEKHHAMIPTSKLVMIDASHFMPFMQVEQTRDILVPFFNRHDAPGVEPETDYVDLAPVPTRAGADAFVRVVGLWIRSLPWWSVLIAATILIRVRPYVGIAIVTVFVALMDIDFGIALLAMFVGRAWWLVRGADRLDRPWTILGWVRGFLYVLPAFVIGSIGAMITLGLAEVGDWIGLFVGFWITWAALRLVRLMVTREGWQRIRGRFQRLMNHEYYPSGVLYLTTLIAAFARIASGKGLRPLTAVNPGYSRDGGLKEERKSQLDARFPDDPSVLRCVLIGPDRDARRRGTYAGECISTNPALGGYPIIAKPDQGARGEGVRIIRDHNELTQYCADRREPFVLQRFHPGPIEVGILWIRHADTIAEPKSPAGFIYAINKKDFPEIVGDGKRSLRRLILRHPRHRAQARMYIERLREQQHLIPGDGERVSLGSFGNHAQGAMFTDGAELITPELSARIESIADGFRDDQGRGFDIGRFDVRCSSYEALMRGEELGIVELNGLTSEPTNIYDPSRSLGWAWATLLGYWRHVETLADARIADGSGEAISKKEAWDLLSDFLRAMSR